MKIFLEDEKTGCGLDKLVINSNSIECFELYYASWDTRVRIQFKKKIRGTSFGYLNLAPFLSVKELVFCDVPIEYAAKTGEGAQKALNKFIELLNTKKKKEK